jgi:uncharacterized membrane protein YfcA
VLGFISSAWSTLLVSGLLLVVAAGFVAGLLNATTGSGNLVSFVTLVALGVPPLVAHVANQVAAPASFATAWRKTRGHEATPAMWVAGCLGTAVGALALTAVPATSAAQAAPFGVALAAVALLLAPLAERWTARHRLPLLAASGLWGGFVGPGVGTMVAATVDTRRPRAMGATRNALCLPMSVTCASVLVVAQVVTPGLLQLNYVAALAVGMLAGGMVGSALIARLPNAREAVPWFRSVVVGATVAAAAWLFVGTLDAVVLATVVTLGGIWFVEHLRQHLTATPSP